MLRLAGTMESLREKAVANASKTQDDRKTRFDKNSSHKILEKGSLVIQRIPGLHASLTESWCSPFEIMKKLSEANYMIRDTNGKGKGRVVIGIL